MMKKKSLAVLTAENNGAGMFAIKLQIVTVLFLVMFGVLTTIAFSNNIKDTKHSYSRDTCLNVEDLQLSEQKYSEILNENTNDTESLFCRGILRIEIGKYREAIADFTRLIAIKPSTEAYLGRGDAWLKLGEDEKVDLDLINAFRAQGDSKGYYLSARILQEIGRYQDAITDYKKSIEIAPDRISSAVQLAWLYATCENKNFRDGNEALSLILGVINIKGEEIVSPRQYATLAAAYAELGDFDNARLFQEKAIVINNRISGSTNQLYIEMINSFNISKPWREQKGTTRNHKQGQENQKGAD